MTVVTVVTVVTMVTVVTEVTIVTLVTLVTVVTKNYVTIVFFCFFCFFKALALWADAFYKSKCPSVCVSVRVLVCSCFEVPFKRLFAPTSRSRMFKIFRDSASLGKSIGKKWSQI